MNKLALLIVLLVVVALTLATATITAQDNERDALMALYDSTNGSDWTTGTGWGTADPYCDWYGVTCDADTVTALVLENNQLSGPIPIELGNLSKLQSFNLYANNLTGPIPAELTNLDNLKELHLTDNSRLVCWQTEVALNWALGLDAFTGPQVVCTPAYIDLMALYNSTNGPGWTTSTGWGTVEPGMCQAM